MNSIFAESSNTTRHLVARFFVPGEPVSKSRARFTKRGSKTFAYTPQKTLDGEAAVKAAYLSATKKIGVDNEAAFAVHAHFYNGTRQRRDVDNMVKLILDGLNGVAWPDDNQVTEIAARKSYVKKPEAGTDVYVYLIGDMGVPKQPCIRCGTEFRTYESWANDPNAKKYCTSDCFYESVREKTTRTCAHCDTPFVAAKGTSATRYCSRECGELARRAVTACAICEQEFTIQKCHIKDKNYCSTECRKEQDRRAHRERRTTYFPGTCAICGAGTTRKEYKRCNPCKLQGARGNPQAITAATRKEPTKCMDDGCAEIARTKGRCGKHYMQARRKSSGG